MSSLSHSLVASRSFFYSGEIPQEWKNAKVTPIFKAGSEMNIENYRPISVLPVVVKVFERLVHAQLYSFLLERNLLTGSQSGFRPGHSAQDLVLKVVDDWRGYLDDDEIVGSLFIDLTKAFDSIDHQLMLLKLQNIGVDDIELAWFRNYLCGHMQCVAIGKAKSSLKTISSGVPQGSILGPLLFIIFMNNLPAVVSSCDIQLYADDTIVYCHGKTVDEVEQNLTVGFQTVVQWFQQNCLTVNIKKTHSMFLGRKKRRSEIEHLCVEHDGQTLRNEQTARYLGVFLDDKLCWEQHIDSVSKKVSRSLAVLRRASKHLTLKTRMVLYNAVVLPHLDYCSVVWANCTKKLQMRLERLQNYGMRVILQVPARTPSSISRAKLRWVTLEQCRALQRLRAVHRCVHGTAPGYLQSLFKQQPGTVGTRGQLKLSLKVHNTELYRKSFQHSGARSWNLLPDHVKTTQDYQKFSKLAKNFITQYM